MPTTTPGAAQLRPKKRMGWSYLNAGNRASITPEHGAYAVNAEAYGARLVALSFTSSEAALEIARWCRSILGGLSRRDQMALAHMAHWAIEVAVITEKEK